MNYFDSQKAKGRQWCEPRTGRSVKRLFLILLLTLSMAPVSSQEKSVTAIALFDGKSMLSIDGGRAKILKEGETFKGVTLISASTTSALIEVNGQQQSLVLNGTTSISTELGRLTQRNSNVVEIQAGDLGFFESRGSINGRDIRFLVDTGASLVVLSSQQAQSIDLQYLEGRRSLASTASGTAPMYEVVLDSISVGGITKENVVAGVIEGNFPEKPLLGMTFLSQVDITQRGDLMTLQDR